SVRSFTLTNSELITKKTIYTKILTLPANAVVVNNKIIKHADAINKNAFFNLIVIIFPLSLRRFHFCPLLSP
ncbi:hypothetical protein, partial [Dubosiella newyorkensis]|uniref:hypothetical protein n=1 Tax=Dubosiella newyorkensis TaxID=1862672 RepID=UPI00272A3F48